VKLLFKEESEVYLSFGQPMDVFGHAIDVNGESRDIHGNLVDFKGYFEGTDGFNVDGQREQVYTQLLGDKIIESFWKNNVILSSHLVAFTAFQFFEKNHPDESIYQLVNLDSNLLKVPRLRFIEALKKEVDLLIKWEKEGKLKLAPEFHEDLEILFKHGMDNLGVYHNTKVLYLDAENDCIKSEHLKSLLFYNNRMLGYSLENFIDWQIDQ
jgi:glycerol-3-phosphate O-acyltransferase